jgi:hypothetical protein
MIIVRAGVALHNLCVDAAEANRPFVPSRQACLVRPTWAASKRTAKAKRFELARHLVVSELGLRRPTLPK